MTTTSRALQAGKPAPWRLPRVGLLAHAALAVVAVAAGCDPPKVRKPIEMAPIGTVPIVTRTSVEEGDGGTTTPNSGTPNPGKEAACQSAEFESLDEVLRTCDSPLPRTSDLPSGMRDKLELRVTASTPSITPGGRVDLTLTLKNKSNEPLPLYFTGAPQPVFEVEAVDTKGKRIDLPTGKPPKTPLVATRESKAAKITLNPGGIARIKISWDAVKTKWAPDKVKTWEGRGYPRAPAGPLANGKYTLRVVVPLVGVFEKGEGDLPKVPVEVGS